ncbi:MAG TPA: Gfo/Idh/MocA family oxidoreductase [Thermoanaerobaculia bacterium]|nr:Gfo/Idh/MocA family oxidoreductase [Thermoanaerobaculia bacterium]
MTSDPRIAVLGVGHWGRNLVRVFDELGSLAAICDVDPVLRQTKAEEFGVEGYASVQEVLADPAIDGVAIATPAATHAEIARAALGAGKDVFVEKPLALDPTEADDLIAKAEADDRILMVGHILRYHPAVERLLELARDGELGRVQYVYSNRLNIGRIRTEENILWSFAPHDISIMLALLGTLPDSVSCRGAYHLGSDVADVTLSHLSFPGGRQGHVFVSWLHPFKEQRLVVVGSEKMAVFEDTAEEKLLLYPHRVEWKNQIPSAVRAERIPVEVPAAEPLKRECEHFLRCVETRETPLTDGAEGRDVLSVLAACQSSLDQDGIVIGLGDRPLRAHYLAHPTAVIDQPCEIGEGTKIWHFTHVLEGAEIGKNCVFGQNCSVAGGVVIGDGVKVQNNVSIYSGTVIEDYVFLGPSCVLTNVTNPRAEINRHDLYESTLLRRGCTIGANATIVCGVEIGRYAFVAAGAVVTAHVPDYALMVGAPARRVGWVSRHGLPLQEPNEEDIYVCPESGLRYREEAPGVLRCLDLHSEEPLPSDLQRGHRYYDDLVHGHRFSVKDHPANA